MSDNEEMIKVGKDTFEKIIQNKELEKNLEFQNAVNTFYKLKGEYEEKINEQKRKIAKKSHLSAKEKRDEFKQLKIPCVNCKRRTTFNINNIFEHEFLTSIVFLHEVRILQRHCRLLNLACLS